MGFVHKQYHLLGEGFALGTDPVTRQAIDVPITPELLDAVVRNTNALGGCPVDINHDRVERNGRLHPDLALTERGDWKRRWATGTIEILDADLAAQAESGDFPHVSLDIDFDPAKGGHYAKYVSLLTKEQHPAIVGMTPLGAAPTLPPAQYTAGAVQLSQAASAALQRDAAEETTPMTPKPDESAPGGTATPDMAVLLATPEAQAAMTAQVQAVLAPHLESLETLKAQLATAQADGAQAKGYIAQRERQDLRASVHAQVQALLTAGRITPAVANYPNLEDALVQLRLNQPQTFQLSTPQGAPQVDASGQPAMSANDPLSVVLAALDQLPRLHGGALFMQPTAGQTAEMQGGAAPLTALGERLGLTPEKVGKVNDVVPMLGQEVAH